MTAPRDDRTYFQDMIDAARYIFRFTDGMKFHEFERNELVRSAVERKFEILGEAAKGVSASFRKRYPNVPWEKVIGHRNVIAHEYGEILVERLWLVVERHLPGLLTQLEEIFSNEFGDEQE